MLAVRGFVVGCGLACIFYGLGANAQQGDVRTSAASDTSEARFAAVERVIAEQAAQIRALEERLERQGAGSLRLQAPQKPGTERLPPVESPLDRAVKETLEAEKSQESALDKAIRELDIRPEQPTAPAVTAPGAPTLRFIDISVDLLAAAGTSTEQDPQLLLLQGGDHDPRKRGFTIQNLELALSGAIDPYFYGQTNIVYKIDQAGETGVELEEAFATTQQLPCGFEVKAGQFFTEFGRLNQIHPHAWHWEDQPIILTRLFGGDGLRGPGVRLSKLLDTPEYSRVFLGVQNANGETATSFFASEEIFDERPIGGRPFTDQQVHTFGDLLYSLRWETSWMTHYDEVTWLIGVSSLFGPNATGDKGHTVIYGADLKAKWVPQDNERGWPFVVLESEVMARHYRADNFFSEGDDPLDPADDIVLADRTLHDWGFYVQVLNGFMYQWAAGLRYEFAGGEGQSVFSFPSRQDDPFRNDRHRVSPLLIWYPSEFSRIRLQYNFDHAENLRGDAAHSIWIGFEGTYGVHPPHKF